MVIIALIILSLLSAVTFLTRVGGASMLPTYRDGDILLIRPIIFHSIESPEVDEVYIYNRDKRVVKRLKYIVYNEISKKTECFFVGDNSDYSYDSRNYGTIKWKNVKFKVVKTLEAQLCGELKGIFVLFRPDFVDKTGRNGLDDTRRTK